MPTLVKVPGLARGDVPVKMRDDAFGEIVGLDLVGDGQRLDARDEAVVSADRTFQQALVTEPIEAALLAVALAAGPDEREVARSAACKKASLDSV